MSLIAIKLNPERLSNCNADIRYILPDLIIARSGGVASDGGYDYAGDPPDMYIFLETDDVPRVLAELVSIVENEEVLGNHLSRAAEIGVHDGASWKGVYPAGGSFTLPTEIEDHL